MVLIVVEVSSRLLPARPLNWAKILIQYNSLYEDIGGFLLTLVSYTVAGAVKYYAALNIILLWN